MAEGSSRRTGTVAIFGVAVLINGVLSIFLLDQAGNTRLKITDLESTLVSEQDVALLRPIRIDQDRCERCHTDRRYAKLRQ